MHQHEWKAIENLAATYTCRCGAGGRRNLAGRIVEFQAGRAVGPIDPDDLITARPMPEEVVDCTGRRRRLNPDNWRDDEESGESDWGASL